MTHFRLDVTKTSITSITSGFWPDVTLDGSLPGGHPKKKVRWELGRIVSWLRTVAPNIHPNVDGEVAYAAPINGLAVGYIQV